MTSDGKRNIFGIIYLATGRIRDGWFKENMLQGNIVYLNQDQTIVEGTEGWYENEVFMIDINQKKSKPRKHEK